MVVLEAMAMGCSVVASDIPSLRELVKPEEHGVLVPTGDARSLEDALVRLGDDPNRRKTLGEAAAERVRQRFDVGAAAARIAV